MRITPTRFSSSAAPAISIDAPPGWTFSHDGREGKLLASTKGASMMIETSRTTDTADPNVIISQMTGLASLAGAKVERFNETIDGLTASGASMAYAAQSSVIWSVNRGEPILLTVIVCKTDAANARETCRSVLAGFKWRPLGPSGGQPGQQARGCRLATADAAAWRSSRSSRLTVGEPLPALRSPRQWVRLPG